MMRTIRLLLGGMAIALVAACGGGGSSPPAPAAVARVEILPSAVVLTSVGAAKQLVAKAFDTEGNEVAASFTWASTSPAKIGVSASGVLTAITASGSSQVTASAGAIVSAPVLAIVTSLPAGAVALTDAQIVGEPVETTPDAAPSFDNTYQVSLSGVAAPAVGTLLINTEGKAVAGRVLAVDGSVNPIKVTLGLVSLRELFPSLELREVIDLSNAPVTIPADIAAVYNVKRTGDLFEFTPKPTTSATQLPSGRKSALAGAVGTSALPPFSDCNNAFTGRSAEDPLPIALSAPPVFSIKLTPTLDIVYTAANGLERFVVKASPVFTVEGGITVTAAFEGKVECKHEMVVYRIPVGGPLSLVISGLVPAGIGLEVAGKVTVATLGLTTKLEVKSDAAIGVQCAPGAACEFVRSLTFPSPAVALTPTVNLPSIGDLRVEPSLAGFGYVEADIGNPFLKSLRLEAFAAKAGGKYAASFAPMVSQITDTGYKSDYKVSLEASASVGTGLGDVAKLLGLSSISALDLSVSTDIATSPSGVAVDAVTADKANFVTGDTVIFTVNLDPATVEFPAGLFYNVDKVVLVRNSAGNRAIVGTATATSGQTTFSIAFAAPDSGQASEFFAFVVTRLLPFDLLALEVGTPSSGTFATIKREGTALNWFIKDPDNNFLCCVAALLAADTPPPVTMSLGDGNLSVIAPSAHVLAIDFSGLVFAAPTGDASSRGVASVRAELRFASAGTLQIDVGPEFRRFDLDPELESVFAEWVLDSGPSVSCQRASLCQPSTTIAITQAGTRTLDVRAQMIGTPIAALIGGRVLTITFTPAP